MTRPETAYRKTPILIALALSILLVFGVIIGAKIVYDRAAQQPVAMASLDSPDADTAECQQFVDALPDTFAGHKRAELAEPAPNGAAAWASSSTERITLRCGVSVPLQYTKITPTEEIDGVQWIRVDDATPGSTLRTWFAVNKFPLVAVTADDPALDGQGMPLKDLPLDGLENRNAKPFPIPLAQEAAEASKSCKHLLEALPEQLDDDYAATNTDLPQTKAWTSFGKEPVVLRCGVEFPKAYKAGAQLQQINGVPWFEDTTLGNGTTASTWYPMGRDVVIAVSAPNEGNAVLVQLTKTIRESTASA
ncbi:DUF3515 domain-containing protein [Corynebacterium gerontici]|uniref:DUF3515 domain-containing protein n=1 Tax=Corynebacterium gerontici TaxID=2079234 RepID=A0A3G6J2V8_9CORY|nr:DUF3515 domain-containing protein [Corynebacterium gerontici]AZA11308.1 hypothetical protein CGERO_04975 [Corynebacterium gerontici]